MGGLATYLHLDSYRNACQRMSMSRVYPTLAFWTCPLRVPVRKRNEVRGQDAECLGNINANCAVSYEPDEAWRCFMAEYTAPHVRTPMFALQSAYDARQYGNVLRPVLDAELLPNETSHSAFSQRDSRAHEATLAVPTFGLWMDSCFVHGQQDVRGDWNKLRIKGDSGCGVWRLYFNRTGSRGAHHTSTAHTHAAMTTQW